MQNTPLKNGLIMGAVLSIGAVAMAFISPYAFVKYGRAVLLVAALFFMFKIGKDERHNNEGVLSYGEAFKAIFIGSLVAYAILNGVEYILYNYIKPELNALTHELAIEAANGMLDWASGTFDTDQEAMDRAKEEISSEITVDRVARTPMNAMLLMIQNMIAPCIIGGAIMSIFAKSKNS